MGICFQKIKISLAGDLPLEPASPTHRTVLTVGQSASTLPLVGVQVSREVVSLTDEQRQRIRALNLDHLRVDLALSDKSFVKELQ